MRERKTPVAAFRIVAECEACEREGTIAELEHVFTVNTHPVKFMHRCKNGHEELLDEVYPRVVFV